MLSSSKLSYLIIVILFGMVSYLIIFRTCTPIEAANSEISVTDISPNQKTKQLHEMFKLEINKFFVLNGNRLITAKQAFDILNKLYKSMHSIVNFIQIGACNADFDAPGYTDLFQQVIVHNRNYYGVMMEPVPYLFDSLITNMNTHLHNRTERILFLNAGFSETEGIQPFYSVNTDKLFEDEIINDREILNQVGSFLKEHPLKHLRKLQRLRGKGVTAAELYIKEMSVNTFDAKGIWNRFLQNGKYGREGLIDVVEVDAEGLDSVVVKGFLTHHILPLIIVYENLHLEEREEEETIALLGEYGYISFKYGWNSIAIRFADIVGGKTEII